MQQFSYNLTSDRWTEIALIEQSVCYIAVRAVKRRAIMVRYKRRKKRDLSSTFIPGVGKPGLLSHVPHERRRSSISFKTITHSSTPVLPRRHYRLAAMFSPGLPTLFSEKTTEGSTFTAHHSYRIVC